MEWWSFGSEWIVGRLVLAFVCSHAHVSLAVLAGLGAFSQDVRDVAAAVGTFSSAVNKQE